MEWTTSLEATVHPCRYDDDDDNDDDDNEDDDYYDHVHDHDCNHSSDRHDQIFSNRGGVIWRRLTPRTEHWKTRLPPLSLTQWLNITPWVTEWRWEPPLSLCGSVNSYHSVIQSLSLTKRDKVIQDILVVKIEQWFVEPTDSDFSSWGFGKVCDPGEFWRNSQNLFWQHKFLWFPFTSSFACTCAQENKIYYL